jgi:hypothetical protein
MLVQKMNKKLLFGLPLYWRGIEGEALYVTFFACPKKVTKKKTPTKDYIPFAGLFLD